MIIVIECPMCKSNDIEFLNGIETLNNGGQRMRFICHNCNDEGYVHTKFIKKKNILDVEIID